MSNSLSAIYIVLHDSILVDTNGGQDIKCILITGVNAIEYQTNNNFLPGWPSFIPEFCFLEVNDVPNILHHAMQGPRREHFILIVVGNGDK